MTPRYAIKANRKKTLFKAGVVRIITNSAEETFALGKLLGNLVREGDVLCVSGGLGAGKTVLAKGIASGMDIKDTVTSPTFTLINEYKGRLPFYHMDVYRLCSPWEMTDLGYMDYFYGSGVVLVEWAEKVREILPPKRLEIRIKNVPVAEEAREIIFVPRGIRYRKLVEDMVRIVCTRD
jgi:tRNA threonylcarbamoyladenosine biosynthesis protein TsaE